MYALAKYHNLYVDNELAKSRMEIDYALVTLLTCNTWFLHSAINKDT